VRTRAVPPTPSPSAPTASPASARASEDPLSSVVLGALLGARVLGEGDLPKRILAASAIAAGIAALALS